MTDAASLRNASASCPCWRHPVESLACFQEFCLFAVVGLVSDFFLQMFFFTTVLSIDIRRMEVRAGLRWGRG